MPQERFLILTAIVFQFTGMLSAQIAGGPAIAAPVATTITTDPPGLNVIVDGKTFVSPRRVTWIPGSEHRIAVVSPQGGAGTRYKFTGWSDSGQVGHLITAPDVPAIFAASFQTEYRLSISYSRNGLTVTPASVDGYYSAGTLVKLTVSDPDFHFLTWTGDLEGQLLSPTIQMDSPKQLSGVFKPFGTGFVTTDPPGLQVQVNGGGVSTPYGLNGLSGTLFLIGVQTEQVAVGSRYTFIGWSDGGPQTHVVEVSTQLIAHFSTEYLLSSDGTPSAGGTIDPSLSSSDGYYQKGSTIRLIPRPAPGYRFVGWSGDLATGVSPQSVTMNFPRTVTAMFELEPGPLTLVCPQNGPTQINIDYSVSCTVSGGTPPYRFAVGGSLPAGLTLNETSGGARIEGLPFEAGDYRYAITVFDADQQAAQQTYAGAVTESPAKLSLSPSELHFTAYQGRAQPASQTVTLSRIGDGPVDFKVTDAPEWISASPASGTVADSGELTVAVVTTGLSPGQTADVVSIAPSGGATASLAIAVDVLPFSISASPISTMVDSGGSATAALQVATIDGRPAAVQVKGATSSGEGWLQLPVTTLSAPGSLPYTLNAAGLADGNYSGTITLSCSQSNPCEDVTIAVHLAVGQASPVITQIRSAAGGSAEIAQNTWIEIKGTNLSLTTRTWDGADFDPETGLMPVELNGVSATINGKAAFPYFISPGQINVLATLDEASGLVAVRVSSPTGESAAVNATMQAYAPGLFTIDGSEYAVSTHADGTLVGPISLFPGATTAARPGETIIFYGGGFGQTDPPIEEGLAVQSGQLPENPVFMIGGLPATLKYAAVVSPGLYQFNVEVPEGAPQGDLAVSATYRGFSTQPGVVVTVAR